MTSYILAALAFTLLWTDPVRGDDVQWLSSFSEARKISADTGKPILIHFYSNNCPPCKLLDAKAFKTPSLINSFSQKLVAVKINVDDHRDLADQFQITRWPTDVYLFPNGSELHRMVSPQDPAVYGQVVERVSMRNRDWVLEQNAVYASQQRRAASASDALTPSAPVLTAANPSTRTPSVETAPGQMPKPVIGKLASYPIVKGSTDEEVAAAIEAAPRRRLPASATPVPSQLTNEQHPVRSGLPPIRSGNVASDLESKGADELPAIVPANRYRNQPSPFQQRAAAQSSQPNPYAQPTLNEQPMLAPEVAVNATAAAPTFRTMTNPNTYAPQQDFAGNTGNDRTSLVADRKESPSANLSTPSLGSASPDLASANSGSDTATNSAQVDVVFDGSCPVALKKRGNWFPGSPSYGVRHRGRIYYCESDEARQEFLAAPDDYSPIFSGYDIVEFLEKGMLTPGKKETGCWFKGKVYLFASNETYSRFVQAKQVYIEEIDRIQNSGRVAEAPNPGTSKR